MQNTVLTFLKTYADLSKPILVGVSGGPDSLALLHALVECRRSLPVTLGIAHIDHAWRPESSREAAQLEALAAQLNIRFHLKTLDPAQAQGNLEAHCRQERLSFFASLCESQGYQAVALAHHADDLAETVLKRLFEGACIPNLAGMVAVSSIGGLTVWRPLLSLSKRELLKLTDKLPITPFDDSTNLDPRFLRGRMRSQLIPYLTETFGKDIARPLSRLSAEALEWRDYLDDAVKPLMDSVVSGALGLFFDVNPFVLRHSIELKHAIRELCKQAGFTVPAVIIDAALELLVSLKGNKQLQVGGRAMHIDRGRLFIPFKGLEIGMWTLKERQITYAGQALLTGWQQVWQGRAEVYLPPGDYRLGAPLLQCAYPRSSSLSKLWTDAKVPAFLRQAVPVVWRGEAIAHEFLTGRSFCRLEPGQEALRLSLEFCRI